MLEMRALSFATALLLAVAGGSQAQTAPTVTTADFAWLAGRWEGRMSGAPGVAEVTFSAPRAGLVVGMMRLVD